MYKNITNFAKYERTAKNSIIQVEKLLQIISAHKLNVEHCISVDYKYGSFYKAKPPIRKSVEYFA